MTDRELIQGLIDGTRSWNGGAGLIVPECIAEKLRQFGFWEGYSVAKNLTASTEE